MPSCTLYGILARDRRSAIVFRRGPSRAVLLLRWWLKSDTIEEGQWFRGRVRPLTFRERTAPREAQRW